LACIRPSCSWARANAKYAKTARNSRANAKNAENARISDRELYDHLGAPGALGVYSTVV